MNYSGESGLPDSEEERQEKLNDMLDDQQVQRAVTVVMFCMLLIPKLPECSIFLCAELTCAQVHTASGSKRVPVDRSACEDFKVPAGRSEALQHSCVAEAEELHVASLHQV